MACHQSVAVIELALADLKTVSNSAPLSLLRTIFFHVRRSRQAKVANF